MTERSWPFSAVRNLGRPAFLPEMQGRLLLCRSFAVRWAAVRGSSPPHGILDGTLSGDGPEETASVSREERLAWSLQDGRTKED